LVKEALRSAIRSARKREEKGKGAVHLFISSIVRWSAVLAVLGFLFRCFFADCFALLRMRQTTLQAKAGDSLREKFPLFFREWIVIYAVSLLCCPFPQSLGLRPPSHRPFHDPIRSNINSSTTRAPSTRIHVVGMTCRGWFAVGLERLRKKALQMWVRRWTSYPSWLIGYSLFTSSVGMRPKGISVSGRREGV
jgi:hypothetical protein